VRAAARHAAAARSALAATPYDSPGDARLLALVEACIAYEGGDGEPLSRFLALDVDALAQGEIWPTLVELTLTYGSQALQEHWSTIAARSFLDRWRVTEARSAQFRSLIDIREIALIQGAGRWAEAAARAAALPGRVTQGFVLTEGVTTLADRDEVALALIWLRHLAQTAPTSAGLNAALMRMLDNPHLTARQRSGAEIWRAHVLRRNRQPVEAEAQLKRTLLAAAEEGAVALIAEERVFLTDLLANRRLRDALDAVEPIRRLLRALAETGPGRGAAAQAAGLTRQETRVLHALGEGAQNKAVANLLGLSEATVKFHLANLYRKLGCRTRREAVRAAAAMRLLT
jgi:DNA-binding CsgD family transcriptional regulator